jgi:hypothetical protein
MRDYLDGIDAAPSTLASILPAFAAADQAPRAPRVLAALGPKMLELAAERSDGAHPYLNHRTPRTGTPRRGRRPRLHPSS